MKRTILSILVLLIVEAFIIAGMLLIPYSIPTEVRIMDMVVLSIIVWMMGYDLIRPIVDVTGKQAPAVGTIGVRWTGVIVYAILAIGLGVLGVAYGVEFKYQLLGQGLFIGVLLLFIVLSMHTTAAVAKVAGVEASVLAGREQMRMALEETMDVASQQAGMPMEVNAALQEMNEAMRYISPNDTPQAVQYEQRFIELANKVASALPRWEMNKEEIGQDLAQMKRTMDKRKQVRN